MYLRWGCEGPERGRDFPGVTQLLSVEPRPKLRAGGAGGAPGFPGCSQAFSSSGEPQPLFSCGAQPSHRSGFSSGRARALGTWASAAVAHGLSCPVARGISPDQGLSPRPLHRQVDSERLGHQGSPKTETKSTKHRLTKAWVQSPVWVIVLSFLYLFCKRIKPLSPLSLPAVLLCGRSEIPCPTERRLDHGPPWPVESEQK